VDFFSSLLAPASSSTKFLPCKYLENVSRVEGDGRKLPSAQPRIRPLLGNCRNSPRQAIGLHVRIAACNIKFGKREDQNG
jgi:hypothetical protein